MTLRTQNLFVLLPVFLGMAVIIGFSRYTAELQELRWGLDQEAASFVTAIAEFLSQDDDFLPAQTPPGALRLQRIRRALKHITAKNRIESLIVFAAADRQPIFTWGATQAPQIQAVPASVWRALQRNTSVVSDLAPNGLPHPRIGAYAPIRRRNQTLTGVLMMTFDARDLSERSRQILRQIVLHAGIIVALGCVAILGVSALISRPIAVLSRLVSEQTPTGSPGHGGMVAIREFSDLGNTFDTMRSVLEESATRLNQALVQGAQFRSRSDLARVYVEDFWPPIDRASGTTEVAGRLIGHTSTGAFFELIEVPDRLYAVVGRLQCEGDLDPVVMASGACFFIREDLRCHEPQEVFRRAADIFVFASFTCVQRVNNQPLCTEWRMQAPDFTPPSRRGARQPPDTVRFPQQLPALTHRQRPFQVEDPLIVHTFTGNVAEQIDVFIQGFAHLSPSELLHDLTIFLGPDCDGAVLILKHRGPPEPEPPAERSE